MTQCTETTLKGQRCTNTASGGMCGVHSRSVLAVKSGTRRPSARRRMLAAAKRKVLGGESLFQNTFTSTQAGQSLWLAPGPEGDVQALELDGTYPVMLQSGAWMASTPAVMSPPT